MCLDAPDATHTPAAMEGILTRHHSPPRAMLDLDKQSPRMDINVIPVVSAEIRAKIWHRKSVYASSHPVRGIALLFFNIQFTDPNFPTRTGAEHDLVNLSKLFQCLSYNVKVFRNLTRPETLAELDRQRSNSAHRDFSSFVLGFSTHGGNVSKTIACSDGRSLYVQEIYDLFDSIHCPYLAAKPKFIFFDASFGCARDRAVPMDRILEPPKTFEPVKKQLSDIRFTLANVRLDTSKPIHVPERDLIPLEISSSAVATPNTRVAAKADFIIAMSTVDGYVSWRRNSHGCWFSRILVEVFQSRACDCHVVELLQLVRRKMAYVQTKTGYKQVNMTIDTSVKQFYFFPGISSLR